MAHPAQVANDLDAQAAMAARGRLNVQIAETSLRRGAATIRELQAKIVILEHAAQDEADKYERHAAGLDK